MATITCKEGHTYDNSLHSRCPQCGIPGLDLNVESVPKYKADPQVNPVRKSRDEKTQGIYPQELGGIDPVVGWLVCLDGSDKGKDYRLHGERNLVGRGTKMDVDLRGELSLTRETEALIVVFEPETRKFITVPGEGGTQVMHNGKSLYAPVELSAYDLIQLGNTQLIFVPFCGDKFSWT